MTLDATARQAPKEHGPLTHAIWREWVSDGRPAGGLSSWMGIPMVDLWAYDATHYLAPSGKPTNPKDAVGIRKAPMSPVSAPVLAEVGLAMLEGARKYGRHNYRTAGVRYSVYYDAVHRHLMSWWEGEDTDPDSGLPHLVKAIACLTVIRDSIIRENAVDDRPPKMKDGWLVALNAKAGEIIDRYPNPQPAHTEAQNDPFYDPDTGRRAGS